jgi:hypothetical protein
MTIAELHRPSSNPPDAASHLHRRQRYSQLASYLSSLTGTIQDTFCTRPAALPNKVRARKGIWGPTCAWLLDWTPENFLVVRGRSAVIKILMQRPSSLISTAIVRIQIMKLVRDCAIYYIRGVEGEKAMVLIRAAEKVIMIAHRDIVKTAKMGFAKCWSWKCHDNSLGICVSFS